jgi:hypothetical protein
MNTTICTYCDGDYHYGVVWAGYRGSLPPWAIDLVEQDGYWEYEAAPGCLVRFVELKTDMHPSLYRPTFMEQIWDRYDQDWDALFFFDPDIVNKSSWSFYEHWVQQGIALCGDLLYHFPANHPVRLAWRSFAEDNGFPCQRLLNYHYNGGFIGIPRQSKSMLIIWRKLITIAIELGFINPHSISDLEKINRYPYCPHDQTALNLTLMLIDDPLSTVGQEGMDFMPGGKIMSHATSPQVKPWRKKLISSALQGMPPSPTDKLYWQHTQTPIALYLSSTLFWQRIKLKTAAAIGRVIRRS